MTEEKRFGRLLALSLKNKLIFSYVFFVVAYSCFVIIPSITHATLLKYKVSSTGLRLIDATIIVILACIWFAGFYGYYKLRSYSLLIYKEKDGKNVTKLCRGLLLLVLWLPVSSLVSVILKYLALKHPGLLAVTTIVNNYVNLIISFLGFILIGIGARGLSKLVKQRHSYRTTNIFAMLLIYVGLVFVHLVLSTNNRVLIYHLSTWLLLLTIVAPYIYMWYIGLLATYEIYYYRKKVEGIVYKQSWRLLSIGIGWLILMSICFQYLTTLSARLNALSIYWLLGIIYLVLVLLSLGFVFIAIGARKLQKLEEV
jgi:hypothetical protein